jgi:hypothetical protein
MTDWPAVLALDCIFSIDDTGLFVVVVTDIVYCPVCNVRTKYGLPSNQCFATDYGSLDIFRLKFTVPT